MIILGIKRQCGIALKRDMSNSKSKTVKIDRPNCQYTLTSNDNSDKVFLQSFFSYFCGTRTRSYS